MREQLTKDTQYFQSVCILRRLRETGLITKAEYEKIRDLSAKFYDTKLYCV